MILIIFAVFAVLAFAAVLGAIANATPPRPGGASPAGIDDLIPLAEAAALVPGRPPHIHTLHRWRIHGVRGVRLRCERSGFYWYTCRRWVEEFLAALNDRPAPPVARPDVEAACRRLGV